MKNYIQQYLDYLRDNPQRLWFKRKIYGWGWTPATWEGWLTIAVFIAIIVKIALWLPENPSSTDSVWFFAQLTTAVALLILICYKKGESPKWQWGLPAEKDPKQEQPKN